MSEPTEDLVDPEVHSEDRDVEASLRPKRLTEFVGQPKVREQLQVVLESALRRSRPPDHVLLSGPPGLGKTSLAMIIAAELGTPIRVTSGPVSSPALVVAPTSVNGARSSGMAVAPGPLPTTTSTRKSSIAM